MVTSQYFVDIQNAMPRIGRTFDLSESKNDDIRNFNLKEKISAYENDRRLEKQLLNRIRKLLFRKSLEIDQVN